MKKGQGIKARKAEQKAKKVRARKRKRALVLILELLVFFSLLGIGYVINKYDKFQLNSIGEDEIEMNEGVKKESYTTIAVFGGDSREGELGKGTHADTIMVVSIDNETKEVRIVSVYRDLLTRQSSGTLGKANSAYFKGGAEKAISMLNTNFDLDIQDYVTVDFSAMAEVVDLLGGIEIDVSEAEAEEMNNYIGETAEVVGKKASKMEAGVQILDGVQAVTYSRIRKNVGGDYGRTERQRIVIQKMVEKVKGVKLATLNEIIDTVFPKVATNFKLSEMLELAAGVLKYELVESSGFAFEYTDGSVQGVGSVVIPLGLKENVEELHAFLYPNEAYEPSKTVEEISKAIETKTGKTRNDFEDANNTEENVE